MGGWLQFIATVESLLILMRRNSTLPIIRDHNKKQGSAVSSQRETVTVRNLEDKVSSHDQELVKNEKLIITLANEFKMLKEQLEFEQNYNEKYKSTMAKYEEENIRYLKALKEQKQTIHKLEHALKEREKTVDSLNKQVNSSWEKI